MQTALTMAAITLVIGLAFGIIPIKGSPFNDQKRLKNITAIASGIIIASALLVVVPEGFELASENHDDHGDESHSEGGELAGSVALVILEMQHGDINASTAIEEIEELLGGHYSHNDGEHEEEEDGELHHVVRGGHLELRGQLAQAQREASTQVIREHYE